MQAAVRRTQVVRKNNNFVGLCVVIPFSCRFVFCCCYSYSMSRSLPFSSSAFVLSHFKGNIPTLVLCPALSLAHTHTYTSRPFAELAKNKNKTHERKKKHARKRSKIKHNETNQRNETKAPNQKTTCKQFALILCVYIFIQWNLYARIRKSW